MDPSAAGLSSLGHHGIDNLHKRPPHVLPRLGAQLTKHGPVGLGESLTVLGGHGAGFIHLSPHQVQHDTGACVELGLVEPLLHAGEGGAVGDVVDEKYAVRAAVV